MWIQRLTSWDDIADTLNEIGEDYQIECWRVIKTPFINAEATVLIVAEVVNNRYRIRTDGAYLEEYSHEANRPRGFNRWRREDDDAS